MQISRTPCNERDVTIPACRRIIIQSTLRRIEAVDRDHGHYLPPIYSLNSVDIAVSQSPVSFMDPLHFQLIATLDMTNNGHCSALLDPTNTMSLRLSNDPIKDLNSLYDQSLHSYCCCDHRVAEWQHNGTFLRHSPSMPWLVVTVSRQYNSLDSEG